MQRPKIKAIVKHGPLQDIRAQIRHEDFGVDAGVGE
jgi:hypothetical protein